MYVVVIMYMYVCMYSVCMYVYMCIYVHNTMYIPKYVHSMCRTLPHYVHFGVLIFAEL